MSIPLLSNRRKPARFPVRDAPIRHRPSPTATGHQPGCGGAYRPLPGLVDIPSRRREPPGKPVSRWQPCFTGLRVDWSGLEAGMSRADESLDPILEPALRIYQKAGLRALTPAEEEKVNRIIGRWLDAKGEAPSSTGDRRGKGNREVGGGDWLAELPQAQDADRRRHLDHSDEAPTESGWRASPADGDRMFAAPAPNYATGGEDGLNYRLPRWFVPEFTEPPPPERRCANPGCLGERRSKKGRLGLCQRCYRYSKRHQGALPDESLTERQLANLGLDYLVDWLVEEGEM